MGWTDGIDLAVGHFVTRDDWNALLGATGSLMQTATAKVTAAGDIVQATGSKALARLAIGAAGARLGVNAAGDALTYGFVPRAFVYHSASQAISNVTWTALAFDSELYDTDAIHDPSTNNTRLTCKTAGFYLIQGQSAWNANDNNVSFGLRIRLNAGIRLTTVMHGKNDAGPEHAAVCAVLCALAVNDYVELEVYQDAGGNRNAYGIDSGGGRNFAPKYGCSLSMVKLD